MYKYKNIIYVYFNICYYYYMKYISTCSLPYNHLKIIYIYKKINIVQYYAEVQNKYCFYFVFILI